MARLFTIILRGMVRCARARLGSVRQCQARQGKILSFVKLAWRGLVRYGKAACGEVRYGAVRQGRGVR